MHRFKTLSRTTVSGFNARDVMAFIEQDARLSEQRSAATLEGCDGSMPKAFTEAVQAMRARSPQWQQIVDTYDDLIQEHGGPSGLLFDE